MNDIRQMLTAAAGQTIQTTPQAQINALKQRVMGLEAREARVEMLLQTLGHLAERVTDLDKELAAIKTGLVKEHSAQRQARKKLVTVTSKESAA